MRRYLFPVKLTAGLKMAESWMTVRFCISNSQSRVLEEALIRANIPYRIYGGMRF